MIFLSYGIDTFVHTKRVWCKVINTIEYIDGYQKVSRLNHKSKIQYIYIKEDSIASANTDVNDTNGSRLTIHVEKNNITNESAKTLQSIFQKAKTGKIIAILTDTKNVSIARGIERYVQCNINFMKPELFDEMHPNYSISTYAKLVENE